MHNIVIMSDQDKPKMKRRNFNANPHFYDYMHNFQLVYPEEEDGLEGVITMVDGGGQCINFDARGKYQWIWSDPEETQGRLIVTDLVSRDPYRGLSDKPRPDSKLNDFEVTFKIEKELQCLEEGWGGNHLDVKYLVAKERYVFDKDPLKECMKTRGGNLKFMLEGDEPDIDRRTYYTNDLERKTRKELIDSGIDFTEDGYYIYKYDSYRMRRTGFGDFLESARKLKSDTNLESLLEKEENFSIFAWYTSKGELAGYVMAVRKTLPEKEYLFAMWIPEMIVPDEKLQRTLQWLQHEMFQQRANVLFLNDPSDEVQKILAEAEPCTRDCRMRQACKNLTPDETRLNEITLPNGTENCVVLFPPIEETK